ncbi:MAG: nucleoside triphosphate pyrophosphohydrolase [Eubacterium sp.]|nr:nucleoside triphosphate pyrophosphohydrolase [Eubacterium sp.]
MRIYNKLVRDNIPEIIKSKGETPYVSVLTDARYNAELRRKLKEEVREYLMSEEIEELADIIEVIEALANHKGSSLEQVLEIKEKKAKKNGKFEKKLFLKKVK